MNRGMSRGDGMVDARGVLITPGARCIYGFGVSRSVAMAEGVIRDDGYGHVSTTPSGRVWVTIVRRSYGNGQEDRVHVAPDRLVVLRLGEWAVDGVTQEMRPFLPPSPLPTQDQKNRDDLITKIETFTGSLSDILSGGPVPPWVYQTASNEPRNITEDRARLEVTAFYRRCLVEYRDKLAKIEERLPCCYLHGQVVQDSGHCRCVCHVGME